MKALVGAFNQEKALVGAFSVIKQLQTSGTSISSSTAPAPTCVEVPCARGVEATPRLPGLASCGLIVAGAVDGASGPHTLCNVGTMLEKYVGTMLERNTML